MFLFESKWQNLTQFMFGHVTLLPLFADGLWTIMPPYLTVVLSPSGNPLRLFKTFLSCYCSIISSSVIGVPMQTLLFVIIMHHVQFISTNSIFEKDEGSRTVQLWLERSVRHLMFISYKSVIAFYLSILQCKPKPCRKINRDCTSKRQQWQEMSACSQIPSETINTAF